MKEMYLHLFVYFVILNFLFMCVFSIVLEKKQVKKWFI